MLAIDGQPQVDLREGQRRGRPLPVQWVRIEDPDPDADRRRRRRGARSTRAGPRAARSSTASRAAGRTTARSSSSPPAAATSRTATSTPTATRRASARSGPTGPARHGGGTLTLVFESPSGAESTRPDNLTVTPRGGLIACEDDASSAFVDTHPLAPGIDERQPPDRHHPARRGVRARGQRPQRLRAGRRQLQPERPDAVLQPLRPRALRRGPGRGHDLRRHRPLAPRAAVGVPSGRAFRQTALPHMGWLGYTLITVALLGGLELPREARARPHDLGAGFARLRRASARSSPSSRSRLGQKTTSWSVSALWIAVTQRDLRRHRADHLLHRAPAGQRERGRADDRHLSRDRRAALGRLPRRAAEPGPVRRHRCSRSRA